MSETQPERSAVYKVNHEEAKRHYKIKNKNSIVPWKCTHLEAVFKMWQLREVGDMFHEDS